MIGELSCLLVVSDTQLLDWNRRGLIPGPNETHEQFLQRVALTLDRATRRETRDIIEAAQAQVLDLYDISPDWMPIQYSNKGLGLWHGGATLLEDVDGHPMATIQLRESLARKGRYIGLYSAVEFVAHEMVHVGRVAFEEHRFEEMLAYQTSPSRFRRVLGPVFRTGVEAWLFVISLLVSLALDYAFFSMDWVEAGSWALLMYAVPLGLLSFGLCRLMRAHLLLNRCLMRLTRLTFDRRIARHVLYRLTDVEVRLFAHVNLEQMQEYICKQGSIRWHVIKIAYLLGKIKNSWS